MIHFQIHIMRFLVKQGSQYLFMSKNYFIFEANMQIRLHFGGLLMSTFKCVKIHVTQPRVKQTYLMWSKNQEKSRSNSPFGSWKNARHICVFFTLAVLFYASGHTSTDFFAFCCETWHIWWMTRHLVSWRVVFQATRILASVLSLCVNFLFVLFSTFFFQLCHF